MATVSDLERIALSLPEVTQGEAGFAVYGKGFTWVYAEKIKGQKERTLHPEIYAVRVANAEEKALLLAADPTKFFTDDHYNGFPAVMVRLAAVEIDELTELLTEAWRVQAPRKLVKQFDSTSAPLKQSP